MALLKMFLSVKKKAVTGSQESLSSRWINTHTFLLKKLDIHFLEPDQASYLPNYQNIIMSEMPPFWTAEEQYYVHNQM